MYDKIIPSTIHGHYPFMLNSGIIMDYNGT